MTRTRTVARVRTTVAAASVLCLAGVGAAQAAGGIGAPGVGDPYHPTYGNGGYDVQHYDINVDYRPKDDHLRGRTVLDATTTQYLTQFNLDFALDVTSVKVNGELAAFDERDQHEVVVRPAHALAKGEHMRVEVTYQGVPSEVKVDGWSAWIRTDDGAVAVGEPEIAAWWYPSNDHPSDKALFDISVTVPKGVEAISNGRLRAKTTTGDKTTWDWHHSKPMASYLAFFAAGQYDITRSTMKDGTPIINAIASNGGAEGKHAAADFARTGEVIDWHARQWGAYPFEATGNVAPAASFGFALENQTRPVYSRKFWANGSNMYVVVHEQAHQWYGDSVSVQTWPNIWLNEGFATYAEMRWSETHGEGTGNEIFADWYSIPTRTGFWDTKIGDPGSGNEFDSAVYLRGGMTLQALRNRVGTPAFFTIMRTWAAQHRYGNGTIEEFIALAEKQSGQDLGDFFHVWLYTSGRPAVTKANGFPKAMIDAAATGALEQQLSSDTAPASAAKIKAVAEAVAQSRR